MWGSNEIQMNDSSYLAYSLACALVPHTIERVPGIQSRLWAACQRRRPELETPHRSAGHLDAKSDVSKPTLKFPRCILRYFKLFYLLLSPNYRAMLWSRDLQTLTVSKPPVFVCSDSAFLFQCLESALCANTLQ